MDSYNSGGQKWHIFMEPIQLIQEAYAEIYSFIESFNFTYIDFVVSWQHIIWKWTTI